MNEKREIIKKFNQKIRDFKKHNENYYNKDNPKISDSEYDELKKEIIELENKYSFLKKIGSVENSVGATPLNKFKKVKHLSPMLSLSNAFNKNDMSDFLKKINNYLNINKKYVELFAEPKSKREMFKVL